MTEKLTKLEENSLYEDSSNKVPPSDIIAFNELRSCADLFRMYGQEVLEISPEFQRDIVWGGAAQTRFIDSLIKQLPIPSMCFALDFNKQQWIVIDGLQRMSTIIKFLKGGSWKLSKLDDIEEEISGQYVSTLKDPKSHLNSYYKRVENLTVPITVLRCEFDKPTHMEYLFTIFHRLNTGGMKLNNQEIRNCIYGGSFNEMLKRLDNKSSWRKINKMRDKEMYHYTKQEIILRFFAFYDGFNNYNGQLAKFLNDYMGNHRNAQDNFLKKKEKLFGETIDCLYKNIFEGEKYKKIPTTVLEGLLVGAGKNIEKLKQLKSGQIKKMYKSLVEDKNFSREALTEGLAKRPRVIERMKKSISIFSGS